MESKRFESPIEKVKSSIRKRRLEKSGFIVLVMNKSLDDAWPVEFGE